MRPYPGKEEDAEFEDCILAAVPENARVKAFYVKLAGTKHTNSDGSSRIALIDICKALDEMDLRPEPENPFDPNAVAVRMLGTGKQVGYLDAWTAREVTQDRAKYGDRWTAFFRHKDYSPENHRPVGAVLYLVRMTDEFYKFCQERAAGHFPR